MTEESATPADAPLMLLNLDPEVVDLLDLVHLTNVAIEADLGYYEKDVAIDRRYYEAVRKLLHDTFKSWAIGETTE